jgi:hypothetical protein
MTTTCTKNDRAARSRRIICVEILFAFGCALVLGVSCVIAHARGPVVLISGGLAAGCVWHLFVMLVGTVRGRHRRRDTEARRG